MIFINVQVFAQSETPELITVSSQDTGLTGKVLEKFEVGKLYQAIIKFPYAKMKTENNDTSDEQVTIYKRTVILIRGEENNKGGVRYYFTPLDRDSEKTGLLWWSEKLRGGVKKRTLLF